MEIDEKMLALYFIRRAMEDVKETSIKKYILKMDSKISLPKIKEALFNKTKSLYDQAKEISEVR